MRVRLDQDRSPAGAPTAADWSHTASSSRGADRSRTASHVRHLRLASQRRHRRDAAAVRRAPRAPRESRSRGVPGWGDERDIRRREALYAAVCERGLEGVVAKKLSDRHRPGSRSCSHAPSAASRSSGGGPADVLAAVQGRSLPLATTSTSTAKSSGATTELDALRRSDHQVSSS